jgi:hypothetical protein
MGGSGSLAGSGGKGGTAGSLAGGGDSSSGRTNNGGATGSGGKTGSGGTTGSSSVGVAGSGGKASTGGSGGRAGATSSGGSSGIVASAGTGGTGGSSGGTTSTGPCTPTWQDPPTNVSAWIDASWKDQLSSNVKSRKDWLIDNVMVHKGQINLCVRWGATSAPSAAVKTGMASAVEKWFNDWFTHLSGYGCFPYDHIAAKVTGWAVKPGNESWVSDLGSSVKVYTETDNGTDPPGEPKCPDACSYFGATGNTDYSKCPGGPEFHVDYWLWLDDKLPGSGAAAVGGDWGLRMPVNNFVASMGKSNLVIEHEMGHGFGFQDYYEWPKDNPTPAGGSLMIVGSTSSQTPTIGDIWLLRRTWREMKTLRGW